MLNPNTKMTQARLTLSAAFLDPERVGDHVLATCPDCRLRTLKFRALSDGRIELRLVCRCDPAKVFATIGREAEENLGGDGWNRLARKDFSIVGGAQRKVGRSPCLKKCRMLRS